MLIQFRVENHRSLRDEQVLSLVAANLGDPEEPRLLRPQGLEEALLPAVALYGANASGKSNVLNALGFMREAVLRSHRFWAPEAGTPQEPFALSSKAREPSLYEVDILIAGVRFRYGFVLSRERIEEEWLHTWTHGRKQVLFEREGDHFEFDERLRGENKVIRGLTRANSLFLSTAAQNSHAALLPIFGWFQAALFKVRRSPFLESESAEVLQRERDALVHLLRTADLGVLDIKVMARDVPHPYKENLEISLCHQGEAGREVWLPMEWESAGTITLLDMAIRLVAVLKHGGLLCVDEVEASLHPMLGSRLLQFFHDPRNNPRGAQLLFTTYGTNLLGNVLGEPVLRRDQIWLTEKDPAGATHLYPLTDFHPREEENLERGYLQGRYGAVPFLGQDFQAPLTSAA
jgi:predicted ATPase